nr:MAG TPA: integrase [Caudoviricetes sp.]
MKIDFALEKYLKYKKFVEKVSTNTQKLHRGAITRFIQFLFVQRSEIPELNEI